MQKQLRLGIAAFSLMIVSSAQAGQLTNLQLYDRPAAPTATISFTNANGTGSNIENVYADPQVYTANYWQATHDQANTLYQDLVSAPRGGIVALASVPEPSSVVLASISVLFLSVMHWWRRIA